MSRAIYAHELSLFSLLILIELLLAVAEYIFFPSTGPKTGLVPPAFSPQEKMALVTLRVTCSLLIQLPMSLISLISCSTLSTDFNLISPSFIIGSLFTYLITVVS